MVNDKCSFLSIVPLVSLYLRHTLGSLSAALVSFLSLLPLPERGEAKPPAALQLHATFSTSGNAAHEVAYPGLQALFCALQPPFKDCH